MGRYYRLTKKPTAEQQQEALKEILEVMYVKSASFSDDGAFLHVSADEERYPEVMSRAVNICRRVAGGAEMSFAGFERS